MKDGNWGEHELDYILLIRDVEETTLRPNPEEVLEISVVNETELRRRLLDRPNDFTPWFRLFWQHGLLSSWWRDLDNSSSYSSLIQRL